MSLALLSVRNALRSPARTLLTLLGTAVAIVGFVLLRTVLVAYHVYVDTAHDDRLLTRHKVSGSVMLPLKAAELVRGLGGVQQATAVSFLELESARDPGNTFPGLAVECARAVEVFDEMILTPDERARWVGDRAGAVVGDVLAKRLKLGVGDQVTLHTPDLGELSVTIDAVYRVRGRSGDRSTLLFHWEYLDELSPERSKGQVDMIFSRIDAPANAGALGQRIDGVLGEKGVPSLTLSERAMGLADLAGVSAVLDAVDWASIIVLLIITLVLGNTLAMGVRERTTEYAVLRAIGFTPWNVGAFVLGESAVIGFASGAVGVLVAYPVVELGMGRWLEENLGGLVPYFRIDAGTLVAAALLPGVLAMVAALLPAIAVSRVPVVSALRRVG